MKFDFTKEPGKVLFERQLNRCAPPKVSIITPYYNATKHFEQTFNCVLNQTFPWFEWIIVNDGSDDISVLENFCEKDPRIKLIHRENRGPSAARNTAIKYARTEFIIPIDADDLVEPFYIEVLYWGLYFNPQCAFAYTKSVGFDGLQYIWDKNFNPTLEKFVNLLTNSAIIRKCDILSVGCFDDIEKLMYEDWLLWLKLLSKGAVPLKLDCFGFWYRRTDTGVYAAAKKDDKTSLKLIAKVSKSVDVSIIEKGYPQENKSSGIGIPKYSSWIDSVYQTREKRNILMIITDAFHEEFLIERAGEIRKENFNLSIAATLAKTDNQIYNDITPDFFCLPSFLDMENWAEFISYLIKSRRIEILFLEDEHGGLYNWISDHFLDLIILDYSKLGDFLLNPALPRRENTAVEFYNERFFFQGSCEKVNKKELFKNKLKSILIPSLNINIIGWLFRMILKLRGIYKNKQLGNKHNPKSYGCSNLS